MLAAVGNDRWASDDEYARKLYGASVLVEVLQELRTIRKALFAVFSK